MKLTAEEQKELDDLEKEEKDRLGEEAAGRTRQHLEALRLAKRLAKAYGKVGHDFVVLETRLGNFAVRRPVDVEFDTWSDDKDDSRAGNEKFAAMVTIEPAADALKALFVDNLGLAPALCRAASELAKVTFEENAKK